MTYCAETFHGIVHRFETEDSPCYCGAVIRNRRQHPRVIVVPKKPDGSKTAPIVLALERQGPLTIAEIVELLHESKEWVKYATCVLMRAKKIHRSGTRTEYDARNYKRSVAIYASGAAEAYPEVPDVHA